MSVRSRWAATVVVTILAASSTAAAEWDGSAGALTGLGYDGNAFLSPDSAYFDPFAGTVVNPDRQGGWFVPYGLDLRGNGSWGRLAWPSRFRARGRSYVDSDLRNADTYRLSANTGLEWVLAESGPRQDRFYLGPSVAHVKKTYFDRDSGTEKETVTTGESLTDRYVYTRYGMEARLRMRARPLKYQLRAKAAHYDYEEVPALSSLDYAYYLAGAEVEFAPLRDTKLTAGYDYFVRDYDSRRARNRNGDQVAGNDVLRYDYHAFALGAAQRLGKSWRLYVDYDLLQRRDQFAGYNDYTRHRIGVRGKFKDKAGRSVEGRVRYWQRDYPNAFAFDDPAFDKKEYRTWDLSLDAELPLTSVWRLWADQELRLQDTTDPRYEYDRYQFLAGVAAEF